MDIREEQILGVMWALTTTWLENPELRLGQLLENVIGSVALDTSHICIFYLSDADLVTKLQEFRDNAEVSKSSREISKENRDN